jgi:acyl carrier protein phosphodiesterase
LNFLAHIYLSSGNPEVQIGNFIADWVKGKNYEKYKPEIKKGIILHREIDSFTDAHPLWKHSRNIISEVYGIYSGIIVDIFYDHYLAKNWKQYSEIPLKKYSRQFYLQLVKNYSVLPPRVKRFMPYLIASDRLASYATHTGIRQALEIMSERTSLPNFTLQALELLKNREKDFEKDFSEFFPELINFAVDKFGKL